MASVLEKIEKYIDVGRDFDLLYDPVRLKLLTLTKKNNYYERRYNLAELQDLHRVSGDNADILLQICQDVVETKNYRLSIHYLKQAIQKFPSNKKLIFNIITLHIGHHHIQLAKKKLLQFFEENKNVFQSFATILEHYSTGPTQVLISEPLPTSTPSTKLKSLRELRVEREQLQKQKEDNDVYLALIHLLVLLENRTQNIRRVSLLVQILYSLDARSFSEIINDLNGHKDCNLPKKVEEVPLPAEKSSIVKEAVCENEMVEEGDIQEMLRVWMKAPENGLLTKIHEYLKRFSVFSNMPQEVFEDILMHSISVEVDENNIICEQNETSSDFYILVSGFACTIENTCLSIKLWNEEIISRLHNLQGDSLSNGIFTTNNDVSQPIGTTLFEGSILGEKREEKGKEGILFVLSVLSVSRCVLLRIPGRYFDVLANVSIGLENLMRMGRLRTCKFLSELSDSQMSPILSCLQIKSCSFGETIISSEQLCTHQIFILEGCTSIIIPQQLIQEYSTAQKNETKKQEKLTNYIDEEFLYKKYNIPLKSTRPVQSAVIRPVGNAASRPIRSAVLRPIPNNSSIANHSTSSRPIQSAVSRSTKMIKPRSYSAVIRPKSVDNSHISSTYRPFTTNEMDIPLRKSIIGDRGDTPLEYLSLPEGSHLGFHDIQKMGEHRTILSVIAMSSNVVVAFLPRTFWASANPILRKKMFQHAEDQEDLLFPSKEKVFLHLAQLVAWNKKKKIILDEVNKEYMEKKNRFFDISSYFLKNSGDLYDNHLSSASTSRTLLSASTRQQRIQSAFARDHAKSFQNN